ncbi:beta-hexosaminidase, partial [Bacteroides thetaiotaomicron]
MFVTSAFLFLYYWNLSIKQVHLSCQYINNLTQFQTMKKSISLLLLSLLMITPSCQKPKEVTNEYNIVPQPNQLVPKEGRFELSNKVRLVVPSDAPEVKKVADGFAEQLKQTAGISLKEAESVDGKPAISFVLQEGMPKEGYKLSVTPTLITVTASQPIGFFYGVQTIYQLLPP